MDAAVQGQGGREEVWPLPKDVKEGIDNYLRLDWQRREVMHSGGEDAFLFQLHTNYRTLDFDKPLSTRMVQKIVKRWADYFRLGDLSPHHLRRTTITRALESGLTYRQVQMMSKHRDPKTVMHYDHGRENLEQNAVNFLNYGVEYLTPKLEYYITLPILTATRSSASRGHFCSSPGGESFAI